MARWWRCQASISCAGSRGRQGTFSPRQAPAYGAAAIRLHHWCQDMTPQRVQRHTASWQARCPSVRTWQCVQRDCHDIQGGQWELPCYPTTSQYQASSALTWSYIIMSLVKCIEGVRSEVTECRWPSTCPMRFASQRVEEDGVLVSGHIFQPRPLLLTIKGLQNTIEFIATIKITSLLFIKHTQKPFSTYPDIVRAHPPVKQEVMDISFLLFFTYIPQTIFWLHVCNPRCSANNLFLVYNDWVAVIN